MYSGTPPYDHPVYKTTSLLRPYSFKPNVKTIESFYYFEDPVNATTSLLRPGFYGPTVVALTGFHCKSNCEEHAGFDKRFEDTTLFLDYLPHKIQFAREKITLKTMFLSREANTLPPCKSSCEEQAGSEKNWSVKPYSLMSCCFKRNL